LNCCQQPYSSLGYPYYEFFKLSFCLVFILCLFLLAVEGLLVWSLLLGVLCSICLPTPPRDREGDCCRCGPLLWICVCVNTPSNVEVGTVPATLFSWDDWVSTPCRAIPSVVMISSTCCMPSPSTRLAALMTCGRPCLQLVLQGILVDRSMCYYFRPQSGSRESILIGLTSFLLG